MKVSGASVRPYHAFGSSPKGQRDQVMPVELVGGLHDGACKVFAFVGCDEFILFRVDKMTEIRVMGVGVVFVMIDVRLTNIYSKTRIP